MLFSDTSLAQELNPSTVQTWTSNKSLPISISTDLIKHNNLMIPSSETPETDHMVRHTRVSPALKGRLAQQTLKEMNRRGTSEKRQTGYYRMHMHLNND